MNLHFFGLQENMPYNNTCHVKIQNVFPFQFNATILLTNNSIRLLSEHGTKKITSLYFRDYDSIVYH